MTRGSDQGQATVLLLGVVLALLAVTVGALEVARAVALAHRARTAADFAALAGAVQVGRDALTGPSGGTGPCAAAAAVAAANGAELVDCRLEPARAVWVRVGVPTDRAWSPMAWAIARAGPAWAEATTTRTCCERRPEPAALGRLARSSLPGAAWGD